MTTKPVLLDEVESCLAAGTTGRRDELLRRTVDLFVIGSERFTDREIALFDDVLMRLAKQIETSARTLLALRLAPINKAPPNTIRALAFDDAIEVAGPVLKQSARLDDSMLVKNAEEKSQEHLLAISRRQLVSEAVTDVLVARGDQQVLLSAARNRGARFSDAGFAKLAQRAEGDDVLTESVGTRPEIPPHLFFALLAKASKAVQAKLEAAHPDAKRQVRQAVTEVTSRVRNDTLATAPRVIAARATVEDLHKAGQLNAEKIGAFANAGCFEETTAALALLCDLPFGFVVRAMTHDRAETVLVLIKAARLPWPVAKAVVTLLGVGRPISPDEMAQHKASFERLKSTTAQEIVRFYRARGKGPASRPI